MSKILVAHLLLYAVIELIAIQKYHKSNTLHFDICIYQGNNLIRSESYHVDSRFYDKLQWFRLFLYRLFHYK